MMVVVKLTVACEVPVYFPTNPRATDVILGVAIGLTLALAWHWVAWAVR